MQYKEGEVVRLTGDKTREVPAGVKVQVIVSYSGHQKFKLVLKERCGWAESPKRRKAVPIRTS